MNSETEESTGLHLLKKGHRGLIYAIFSRLGLVVILLTVQAVAVVCACLWLERFLPHIVVLSEVFAGIMVLYLVNSRLDPTAKITWMVVIVLMPLFGALLLVFTQLELGHRAVKARMAQLTELTRSSIPQSPETQAVLEKDSPETAALARYVGRTGCFPVYDRTSVQYFPSGEAKFAALLPQLERAEKFIFLEYFILDEGLMWGKVLEILARKAAQGVEVRVMYDGTCEFSTMPHDYPKRLKALGIRCKIFAPLTPFLSTHYNYRDHRKILVIDGHTAFTGGINLADEYINRVERFGHWKDTAIQLQGEAVKTFTLLFLQMWNFDERVLEIEPYLNAPALPPADAAGYVIPYGDSPLDNDKVGERVYMDILNHANRYVHIMSPYLILDGTMETALKFAAERGVDVALILPGIPDKKIPYALAKTHYESLLASGVRLYEYTPGFVHAKVFVSDDCKGVVGTINLDYRSLYHHFECAAYLYQTPCLADIERDFQETLQRCRLVTAETIKGEKRRVKLLGWVMKVIAPLL